MEPRSRLIPTTVFAAIAPLVASLALAATPLPAEEAPRGATREISLDITLANDTEAERATRDEILAFFEHYDLTPFVHTREVVIDEETRIPHSHPVLTLHTRSHGDDLLATFLHEQLHWMEEEREQRVEGAIEEFRQIYPEVPVRGGQGARSEYSTYLHLVVCDLELQALTSLVGEERARRQLASNNHYQWIYDKVLNDGRVREVNLRHGLVVGETEGGSQ